MLAGIVEPANSQIGANLLKLVAASEGLALIPYDHCCSWDTRLENNNITLAQQTRWNSAQSKQTKDIVEHEASKCKIIAWARIDNQDDLLNTLPKALHSLCSSDAGFILAAYLNWQESACEHLIGDFAFAIYDGKQNSIYLGRDHLGVKPLYYYFADSHFAFASSQAVLNSLSGLNLELSKEWLARYLLGVSQDWSLTTYKNIHKVPPAHWLKFDLNRGKINIERYFNFSSASDLVLGSDDEYVEAYREILNKAIACRVQSDYPIGSESSGGLDSSTVTALASRFMNRPRRDLHAFGQDESELTPECIIAISQTNPIKLTHFASRTRISAGLEQRFYQIHGAPIEHLNSITHHIFYETCEKLGIRTLLSGFGGDEFVTNAAPVALVEFFIDKNWRMFLSRQRGNWLLKPANTSRWLYQYYRHHNHSLISRGLHKLMQRKWQLRLINDETAQKFNLQAHLLKDDIYDGGKLRQNDFILKDRWAPGMTARFENCTLMAASYGIDYRWPLTDIRLLNFYLSVPPEQKLGPNNMGRYLHRRAVSNVLPEFITWKQKDMEPFRLGERIKLWLSRTPLVVKIKNYFKPPPKLKPQTAAEKEPLPIAIHPTLQPLLATDKLNQALKLLSRPGLNKEYYRILEQQVAQTKQLDNWLHNYDLTNDK